MPEQSISCHKSDLWLFKFSCSLWQTPCSHVSYELVRWNRHPFFFSDELSGIKHLITHHTLMITLNTAELISPTKFFEKGWAPFAYLSGIMDAAVIWWCSWIVSSPPISLEPMTFPVHILMQCSLNLFISISHLSHIQFFQKVHISHEKVSLRNAGVSRVRGLMSSVREVFSAGVGRDWQL